VISINCEEGALGVQLSTLVELLKALVEEFKQDQDTVCVDKELGEVDELINAVCFKVLEHKDEQIRNYHGRNNAVSIVLVSVFFKLKEVIVLRKFWRRAALLAF